LSQARTFVKHWSGWKITWDRCMCFQCTLSSP